jgi:hypothetical protein
MIISLEAGFQGNKTTPIFPKGQENVQTAK